MFRKIKQIICFFKGHDLVPLYKEWENRTEEIVKGFPEYGFRRIEREVFKCKRCGIRLVLEGLYYPHQTIVHRYYENSTQKT